jgi:hypothetical protein
VELNEFEAEEGGRRLRRLEGIRRKIEDLKRIFRGLKDD